MKKNLLSRRYIYAFIFLCFYIFDKGFLPSTFKKPFVITDNNSEFICDKEFDEIEEYEAQISANEWLAIILVIFVLSQILFLINVIRAFIVKKKYHQ